MNRVVITGVGAACAFGGWDGFRRGVREGRSGVSRVRLFDPETLASKVAVQTDEKLFRPIMGEKAARQYSRAVMHAVFAAGEAFANAGLSPASFSRQEAFDTAVYIGSGGGGADIAENQYSILYGNNGKKVSPFAIPVSLVGMVSSEVSARFGLHGTSQVISTGCTSSTDALGTAFWMIKTGAIRRALAGGADSCVTRGVMTAFDRMGVMSRGYNDRPQTASRPFSVDRDGFVLGEGGWMFTLEREDDARKRGAPIVAEILGYASNCEAGHRVRMNEDGELPAMAIKQALENARVASEKVSYVSLHGTGTRLNDVVETRALKIAFGARVAPGSAPKSMLGHPQGACGAMGLAATLAGMEGRFLPPTLNLERPDPLCDLDYVPKQARDAGIRHAVLNCMGFGSRNSALVIRKYE